MKRIYIDCIKHFHNRQRPNKILKDTVTSYYIEQGLSLPKGYHELIYDYSKIDINTVDDDMLACMYWDCPVLSDEFICYCLPRFLIKVLEDGSDYCLFIRLNEFNFEELSYNDCNILLRLIKEMSVDEELVIENKGN